MQWNHVGNLGAKTFGISWLRLGRICFSLRTTTIGTTSFTIVLREKLTPAEPSASSSGAMSKCQGSFV